MIEYMKNKNFIPKQFYNRVEQEKIKRENQLLILFFAVNVFLLPISITTIDKMIDNEIYSKNEKINMPNNSFNLEKVEVWVENVVADYIDEAYITNDKGEIKVSTFNKANRLSLNNKIKINNLELNNDGEYSLRVTLNE